MSPVPLLSSGLASVWLQAFLYGIFFVLSIASLYIQVLRQSDSLMSRSKLKSTWYGSMTPMSVAAILLFTLNTAHWITGVYRAFQAFIYFENGTQAAAYYSTMDYPSELLDSSLLMVSLIIGDAMIIYRLWIVWAYSEWVIIFPVFTLIGLAVCTIGSIFQMSRSQPGEDIFFSETGKWITGNCVFTLCTNVYSTAMIAWRIWHANKEARRFGGKSLMGALGILIESAALYTAWTIFFFVTYHFQSDLEFLVSETYCAVAGISFMLLNVRVGLGWAQRAHGHSSDFGSSLILTSHNHRESAANGLGRLAVNITRVVQRDDDGSEPPIKFASCSSLELSPPVTGP